MRILVTGGSGFLGRRVVSALASKGHVVYSLNKTRRKKERGSNVRRIRSDLLAPLSAMHLPKKIDIVIHLAQSEKFRDVPESSRDVFGVNTCSTLKLLEYARVSKAKKFILASTGSVYGGAREAIREDRRIDHQNLGFYALSKAMAELLVNSYNSYFATVILRFFAIYGVGQRGMLIPGLIDKIVNRKPITLRGKKGISLNPIYVDDAAKMIELCTRKGRSLVLNAGGAEALSILRMSKIIGNQLGIEPVFEPKLGTTSQDLLGDMRAAARAVGFRPSVSFAEGIRRILRSRVRGREPA